MQYWHSVLGYLVISEAFADMIVRLTKRVRFCVESLTTLCPGVCISECGHPIVVYLKNEDILSIVTEQHGQVDMALGSSDTDHAPRRPR